MHKSRRMKILCLGLGGVLRPQRCERRRLRCGGDVMSSVGEQKGPNEQPTSSMVPLLNDAARGDLPSRQV